MRRHAHKGNSSDTQLGGQLSYSSYTYFERLLRTDIYVLMLIHLSRLNHLIVFYAVFLNVRKVACAVLTDNFFSQ